MHVPEWATSQRWRDVQEGLVSTLGLPVRFVTLNGRSVLMAGASFFLELAMKKAEDVYLKECVDQIAAARINRPFKLSSHDGLCYYAVVIGDGRGDGGEGGRKEGMVVVGPARASAIPSLVLSTFSRKIGLEEHELVDAAERLPVITPVREAEILKGLGIIARQTVPLVQDLAKTDTTARDNALLLQAAMEFFRHTEINTLARSALSFFSSQFKLKNCSLRIEGGGVAQEFTRTDSGRVVEAVLYKAVAGTKNLLYITNPSHDVLLQQVQEARALHGGVLALPLVSESAMLGMLTLYENVEHPVEKSMPIISALTRVLTQSAINVLRFKSAQRSAVTDSLTGLYNKRYFLEALKNDLARAVSGGKPTSLFMIDLDNFKPYNDTFGHPAGDELLRQIAPLFLKMAGKVGIGCRYGGEEFAIILPETMPQDAKAAAEELLRIIASTTFPFQQVTASIGVATSLNGNASPEMLLREADKALYVAKRSGKNQVKARIIVDRNMAVIDG